MRAWSSLIPSCPWAWPALCAWLSLSAWPSPPLLPDARPWQPWAWPRVSLRASEPASRRLRLYWGVGPRLLRYRQRTAQLFRGRPRDHQPLVPQQIVRLERDGLHQFDAFEIPAGLAQIFVLASIHQQNCGALAIKLGQLLAERFGLVRIE